MNATATAPVLTEVIPAQNTRPGPLRRADPTSCQVAASISARRATQGDFKTFSANAMVYRDMLRSRLAERAQDLDDTQRIALDAIAGSLAHITTGRHDDPAPWHELAIAAQLVAECLAARGE